ncbi:TonB-dependent receptor [Sphingomonas canadensis]|uniref:TonB-dependent receptor n=1 Tax=Sphingomonas canadensis TaxID=1219257 RepID=A0ABW3H5G4_9SPHN|nr:TonB-dependent receptor [Sphingomonas canadensis]MCW3834682.1 TonB-dependent receptor [Sphingomonas canadensis]
MTIRKGNRTRSALYAGIALCAAAPAHAQQEDGDVAPGEIVVTAERRETRLLDTPISVTAFTAENLADRDVSRIEDLGGYIPGVFVEERALRTQSIAIRGLSADLNNPGLDQSVGLYVDGVYLGRATPGNASLFDLERIEVLRGPQGALYGKNTIAGAINYVTRLPDEELRGRIEAGYGNYDAWRLRAMISGPLAEGVSAGIAGSVDKRDGYVTNLATGVRQDDLDSLALRGTLRFQPNADLDIILRGDVSRDRTNSGSSDVLSNGAFTGSPLADASPTDRTVTQDVDPVQDRDVWGMSAEIRWKLGGGTLTAISALRGFTWHNFADNDYVALDMLSSGIDEDQQQFSQEIRYGGTAGGLTYMAGVYYFRQTLDTASTSTVGPALGIYPAPVNGVITGDVTTDSYAAFFHGDYAFTDQLSLTAGLRYTYEKKKLVHSQTGDPLGILLGTYPQRTLKRSEDDFSPSASLNYKPGKDVLIYASYSRGFKSGGFNVFSVSPTNDARYAPEHVDSYEIGVKAGFLDGNGRISVDVFRMDYSNLQVNQLITVAGVPRFTTSNAASARSRGLEAELALVPAPGLELTATYTYLDADFIDFRNATSGGADYTGNVLALAPRHSGSFAAQYVAPVSGSLELFARGEMSVRSRVFFEPDNSYSQGSVALFNARLGIRDEKAGWGIYGWARNIGDREYVINRSDGAIVPGQVIQTLGAPRTYGVEVSFDF